MTLSNAKRAAGGQGVASALRRHAKAIQWSSITVAVVTLMILARWLPLAQAIHALETWISGLGAWAPLAFGLIYLVAVLALLPATPFSLAAGALFGLLTGAVTVSLASTMAAALAFLIARYLAREAVARWLEADPKLSEIDRAIADRGWRIVALLRLSPAVPFNLQNYLYGLTGIRFWPYLVTSWLAMMPGTLLYVYLGYAGRLSLESAAGGGFHSRGFAEWGFLVVGLVATIAVTLYTARLARAAIRRHSKGVEPGAKGRRDR
jgi:uncharacterized membrane protein YdjX (TVP38/TMEM64 family)